MTLKECAAIAEVLLDSREWAEPWDGKSVARGNVCATVDWVALKLGDVMHVFNPRIDPEHFRLVVSGECDLKSIRALRTRRGRAMPCQHGQQRSSRLR